ncbi:hypothetical protein EAI89_03950 [Eubacterium sp. am_0171]|uniref:Uncharacterized protein n=2 Tax=Lachnospiraceae TaxID=186803 RepID=A0A174I1T8_9FIRM|nr:hypothetical protein [Faecalicatena contorta]RGC29808.1 hypothetical protein DWX41_13400 [Hungatella hathewayi]RYT24790.1 hypothetical protein EAI89_03950 [Eubacterium sp. am_0171]GKH31447.1 hypothetical protein CE91St64_08540 [Faecalicatena contorta]CUO79886.1 Uncharacterised protein [[Eubacterium] contortum] [Faecalicatena contorta]
MWLLSRLTRNKAGSPAVNKVCHTAPNEQALPNCRQREQEKGAGVIVFYHTCPFRFTGKKKDG